MPYGATLRTSLSDRHSDHPHAMKFALCQELFTDRDFAAQCRTLAEMGYDGIEIAPFTLVHEGGDPTALPASEREQLKAAIEDHGLDCVGLHWLLAKTEGFHLTTADEATRRRTADYLAGLATLCHDLGGSVLVLGSPQQRSLEDGLSHEQADAHAIEVITAALPTLIETGTVLALEPLSPAETDYMNSCRAARLLIEAIGSPHVRLHQDVKAMLGEPDGEPLPELIAAHADITAHFHANDANLQGPGMGAIDFEPIFEALHRTRYDGFVSVEVFDYSPGADAIAEQSLAYMRRVWKDVTGER